LFSVLLVTAAAATLIIYWARPAGTIANIYQNGICIFSIDLSAAAEPYSFTVEGKHGENTITVEGGQICISEADCPDQVCVHQGWISNSVIPVVCLPHELVIQIEDSAPGNSVDGVSR